MNTLRLGAVKYLNATPLTFGLKELPGIQVVLDTPRRLAEMFRAGQIDVGLVPSIEYPRLGDAFVIPGICISSPGEAWSVILVSAKPLPQVRRLALDVSSLSSAAWVQVLFRERYGLSPEVIETPAEVSILGRDADALAVIGDAAMTLDRGGIPYVHDLGAEWNKMTGLPFVYAFWMCRSRETALRAEGVLLEARSRGLRNIEMIVREESRRLGIPAEVCREYLTRIIRYDLGERELAGLRRFYELCARHGLCPSPPSLRFAGSA